MATNTPRAQSNAAFEQFEKGSPTAFPKLEEPLTPRRRWCGNQKVWAIVLMVVGSLTAILGILYGTALPAYVSSAVNDQVVSCSDDDVAKEVYLDPYGDCDDCSPYYVSVYMLNATNAEDYLASNAKLQVQEMGPYVYRRREIKLDVSLSDDASTVTYKTYTYHTYVADKSCDGCSDSDEIVSFDTGYFSVIAATGGEFNLLALIASASFASNESATAITKTITENGEQMMRWMNGLNSLDSVAMKTVTDNNAVVSFLAGGPETIADLDLSGFAYNGIFAKRTASQWALGYPSLLAGLILGSNYLQTCETGMNAQCESCSGDDCVAIAADCAQCTKGAAVVAVNNVTCATIESIYAAEYGATEAASFVATTCGLCESLGLCAAPLPGIAESSGMDYSTTAPDASSLSAYVKRTGCDDLSKIGEYEQYDGITVAPVWVDLGERRNPTLAEIIAFMSYANCAAPVANITCFNVSGTDGSALKPGGVTINGMAKHTTADAFNSYEGAAEIYIAISSMDTEVDFDGVSLHRFGTPSDTFDYTNEGAAIGTGIPVNGLHQLSFVTGFLSYMSGPFFIYGDTSLLEAVEMTNANGTLMTADAMYESDGNLVESLHSSYGTFVDIESGTGQTMSARKRSQVSYAVAASTSVANASMSDMLWPTLPTEVVLPTYWVQEAGEAKDSVVDTFKSTLALVKTFLPGLIVLIIVGAAELSGGVFLWRRHKQKLASLHYSSPI
ncbi:Scavenger receptor class B member 1 [Phytophthora ramorum]|uniref:Scavenger receptor class B member 1 n=1 Tax=Phytophthora ramorum TaxID=164328 RepID=UPI003098CE1F|nr:Scavenger receptor class B member 1 [Phytophthora ramorum]